MTRSFLLGCLLIVLLPAWSLSATPGTFAVAGDKFLLNGKPFIIHSGEIHYSRIPHEYWRQRLKTVHAMGLNTICTYIFWNFHESTPGKWDFTGDKNIADFIREAQQEGLYVLVRPGPYVCSEWDFGGLPSWLLKDPEARVRCSDPRYLRAIKLYIDRIAKELVGLQIDRGGPILMVQVENEYGSYGNDTAYTRTVARYLRQAGFTVPFYTSDGPAKSLLEAGKVDGAIPVINFGGGAREGFQELESFRPGIPEMCGEYWCGWFTHWGDSLWGKANTPAQIEELSWMVRTGKSFNLYMVHGGTNFGWMAGANFTKTFEPDVTSYDYDAPVDETGIPRAKFTAFRKVLLGDNPSSWPPLPVPENRAEFGAVTLREEAPLSENLPRSIRTPQPFSMEHFGQSHGYILYRTNLIGPQSGTLTITEPHDYAIVMVDGKVIGTVDRRLGQTSVEIPKTSGGTPRLDILVSAYGRVNFGPHLLDRKGITDRVTLNGVTLMNWEVFPLPFDKTYRANLRYRTSDTSGVPAFFRGTFTLDSVGDTFLDMTSWDEGVVWVNGRNLGRYWNIGPQRRLYLPGVWLRQGQNDIEIFESRAGHSPVIKGVRLPDFPSD